MKRIATNGACAADVGQKVAGHFTRAVKAVGLGLTCIAYSLVAGAASNTLSIADNSLTQPTTTTNLPFTLTLSGDTSYGVAVQYSTADDTAISGTDYVSTSGTVLIPAGTTSGTINVPVLGMSSGQPQRDFKLNLGNLIGIGGNPSFAAQYTFATGLIPESVRIADLNGDGLPDMVVVNFNSDTVSVLFNTTAPGAATPNFASQLTFATGTHPSSVAVADINGDGKPDLIITNQNDNTVSVLLNTTATGASTPSFSAQQTFSTFGDPISVSVADLNGDGRPDLVVANFSTNNIAALLNTTAPGDTTVTFSPKQAFRTGANPTSVSAVDLNGDGRPDAVTINEFMNDRTISVLRNTTPPGDANPHFDNDQLFNIGGSGSFWLSVADLNGDGRPDLVITNQDSNTVSVLFNTTSPGSTTFNFTAAKTFPTGPEAVSVVDLNGDGLRDLVIANSDTNNVSVLLNITAPGALTPSFATEQTTFGTRSQPVGLAVADFNGDGRADLTVTNIGDGNLSVLLNTTPAPTTAISFGYQPDAATTLGEGFGIAVADFNGDGKPDVVVPNGDSINGAVTVLLGTTAPGATSATFAAGHTFGTDRAPVAVAVGDFNGDGLPDLVTANDISFSNNISVLLNITARGATVPGFGAQHTFPTTDSPTSVAVADFNGDGKPDVVVTATDSSFSEVWVLLNTTTPGANTPSFSAAQIFALTGGGDSVFVGVADFNGDGLPDLAVANFTTNNVTVWLNNTTPGAPAPDFNAGQNFATGMHPHWVSIADFNGDGLPDLAVANEDNPGSVSVLFNTTAPGATTPSFAAQQTFATGVLPGSVSIVDANGDGRPDLVVTNSGANPGSISVLLNTTAPGATTPSFAAQQTFPAGDGPLAVSVADFNGDGRSDLAVLDEGDGTLSVLLDNRYAPSLSNTQATGTINGNIDTTPDAFSFITVNSAKVNGGVYTSNTVFVSGINSPAPISISGDPGAAYSIDGGPFTSAPGTISNGQSVQVEVNASSACAGTTTATLNIGGVSATFRVVAVLGCSSGGGSGVNSPGSGGGASQSGGSGGAAGPWTLLPLGLITLLRRRKARAERRVA